MIDVEGWAELRREHFVRGVPIRELARRSGLARNTVRRALRSEQPPAFRCPERPSLLDPFKEEIHRLLREDPKLPAVRVLELIEPLGFDGRQTIVNKYARELRPLFAPRPRTFRRTSYRPGEVLQFDLWEPAREIPVGHGQTRKGYVVIACLGYSRAGAGALVFSKQLSDLLAGISRCLCSIGGVPKHRRAVGVGGRQRAAPLLCGMSSRLSRRRGRDPFPPDADRPTGQCHRFCLSSFAVVIGAGERYRFGSSSGDALRRAPVSR